VQMLTRPEGYSRRRCFSAGASRFRDVTVWLTLSRWDVAVAGADSIPQTRLAHYVGLSFHNPEKSNYTRSLVADRLKGLAWMGNGQSSKCRHFMACGDLPGLARCRSICTAYLQCRDATPSDQVYRIDYSTCNSIRTRQNLMPLSFKFKTWCEIWPIRRSDCSHT
jgi:hypothetical protein